MVKGNLMKSGKTKAQKVGNITVSSSPGGVPGFFNVTVAAVVTPPTAGCTPTNNTPTATLFKINGGVATLVGSKPMSPPTGNSSAVFNMQPSGTYQGSVSVDWLCMSTVNESGASSATAVP